MNLFPEESETSHNMEDVLSVLQTLRISVVKQEFDLHAEIERTLVKHNMPFKREFRLGPGRRIDFLIPGGIGVEVKKSRPNPKIILGQLRKYAESPEIKSLILVLEKSIVLPGEIGNNKPLRIISTNMLWGVSV